MRLLPLHPVAMRTTFTRCVLVNFAVDPSALRRKLPEHLEPDLHRGGAFVSIVIARMEKMRPAQLPRFAGVTYHQIVYRAVVRCGRERGVTYLRSDADNRMMVAAGNALTFFRFHAASIAWTEEANVLRFTLRPRDGARAEISAVYPLTDEAGAAGSSRSFDDLRAAQAFLSELYVAFGARRHDGRIECVRIRRTPWDSRVVPDCDGVYAAMTSGLLFDAADSRLDSIFVVRNLDYYWDRLSLEPPSWRASALHSSVW